jgi:anti-anti-sigma factor
MAASDNRPHPAITPQLHLITRRPSLGVASVAVTGEVDMATEAELKAALLGALATHHPAVLDVDLSECTFLDCSGVRVLVAVHARARAAGCLVRARDAQPAVQLVLETTGLLALLATPADANAVDRTAGTRPGITSPCPLRAANLPTVFLA